MQEDKWYSEEELVEFGWAQIEPVLERKRRRGFFWMIFACLLVGSASFVYLFIAKNSNQNMANQSVENTEQVTIEQEHNSEKEAQVDYLQNELSNSKFIAKPIETVENQKPIYTENTSGSKQNQSIVQTSIPVSNQITNISDLPNKISDTNTMSAVEYQSFTVAKPEIGTQDIEQREITLVANSKLENRQQFILNVEHEHQVKNIQQQKEEIVEQINDTTTENTVHSSIETSENSNTEIQTVQKDETINRKEQSTNRLFMKTGIQSNKFSSISGGLGFGSEWQKKKHSIQISLDAFYGSNLSEEIYNEFNLTDVSGGQIIPAKRMNTLQLSLPVQYGLQVSDSFNVYLGGSVEYSKFYKPSNSSLDQQNNVPGLNNMDYTFTGGHQLFLLPAMGGEYTINSRISMYGNTRFGAINLNSEPTIIDFSPAFIQLGVRVPLGKKNK